MFNDQVGGAGGNARQLGRWGLTRAVSLRSADN